MTNIEHDNWSNIHLIGENIYQQYVIIRKLASPIPKIPNNTKTRHLLIYRIFFRNNNSVETKFLPLGCWFAHEMHTIICNVSHLNCALLYSVLYAMQEKYKQTQI